MAQIYRRVKSRKIEKVIAVTRDAQRGVDDRAVDIAIKAEGILDADSETRTGTSYIEVEKGRVDSYIVLNDVRGQWAAMTIEFGREGGNLDKNGNVVTPSRAVAPLRKAAGLRG